MTVTPKLCFKLTKICLENFDIEALGNISIGNLLDILNATVTGSSFSGYSFSSPGATLYTLPVGNLTNYSFVVFR